MKKLYHRNLELERKLKDVQQKLSHAAAGSLVKEGDEAKRDERGVSGGAATDDMISALKVACQLSFSFSLSCNPNITLFDYRRTPRPTCGL